MRLHLLSLLILPLFAAASTEEQMVLPGVGREPFVPVVNSGKPSLADLLTIESTASIFFSYARELEISQIFSDSNARSTVLVPTNKAVVALPRKPHEDSQPLDDGVVLSEAEFDAMSKKNVERWVSAHIISKSPISLGTDGEYETLLSGKNVTFTLTKGDAKTPEWTRALLDGSVRLIDMKEASNGVMYLLDGTVKLD
ncbi:hypothetical protein V8D89_006485 [Ganoderma adspersum]